MCRSCSRLSDLASPTRRRFVTGLACTAIAPSLSGCERAASFLVPSETIERLGLEAWSRLRAEMPATRDPALREAAGRVAERLLVAEGADPSAWEVEVFAAPGVNAFVLPGRKIGILEGLFPVAQSEGGLAAVVGHEIGHLAADHARERVAAQVAQQVGVRLVALALDIGDVAFAREIAAALGVGVEFGLARPYGRAQELEADRLGLFMMARAGYDPEEAVGLWQRMDAASAGGPPAILSTHPAPQDRIEAIRAMLPEARAATAGAR
ncbi:Zn-dependent protease [Salinarimonas ramus]|uniref:Zn-dependent protease n=2 Tax=Salinarimonas ramus TaxID=690164 RepID=A0A917V4D6_9HYPH|nr:Zn-dependent protease [Salinarimonas ramus]